MRYNFLRMNFVLRFKTASNQGNLPPSGQAIVLGAIPT